MAERSEAGRRVPEAPVGEAGGSRPLGGTLLDGWLGRAVLSIRQEKRVAKPPVARTVRLPRLVIWAR